VTTIDYQTADKFLETVSESDCLCQESAAMPWVVDIRAMTRLLATTCEQVPWQWQNSNSVGGPGL
jgi:hypothetical protein